VTTTFRFVHDPLDLGSADPAHGREKRPLVRKWHEVVINEDAVGVVA
jgi:hypothetical protein